MKKMMALMLMLLVVFTASACGGEKNPSADALKAYTFEADGTELAIGADVAPALNALGEEKDYYESASCYFTGLDKIYSYAGFEIHTYPDGQTDRINRVVLLDDTVETAEGIRIGSSQADVTEAYGEATQKNTGSWVYNGKDMYLEFFFKDGLVDQIQYQHPQVREG